MLSLCEQERRAALELARKAVTEAVLRRKLPEEIPTEGLFAQRCGVFVTLHVRKQLQGCIGVTEPNAPLGEAIIRCATCAALEDPRFAPMKEEQIPELSIEISLLSPMQRIAPEEVEIGRHGLLMEHQGHRGLLLPQVATEYHLNREQFLDETCRKAGLPRGAWRDAEARLFGFACEVFSDKT